MVEDLASECWFCLSNPKLSKHLLVSIGEHCYIALPKGQLPNVKEGALVPGGGHVLVVPIAHFPTLKSLPAEQGVPLVSELEKIKSALRSCYAQFGCAFLSFEVARHSGKGGHAHVQVSSYLSHYCRCDAQLSFRSAPFHKTWQTQQKKCFVRLAMTRASASLKMETALYSGHVQKTVIFVSICRMARCLFISSSKVDSICSSAGALPLVCVLYFEADSLTQGNFGSTAASLWQGRLESMRTHRCRGKGGVQSIQKSLLQVRSSSLILLNQAIAQFHVRQT